MPSPTTTYGSRPILVDTYDTLDDARSVADRYEWSHIRNTDCGYEVWVRQATRSDINAAIGWLRHAFRVYPDARAILETEIAKAVDGRHDDVAAGLRHMRPKPTRERTFDEGEIHADDEIARLAMIEAMS